MSAPDLEDRIEKLERSLLTYSQELRLALRYVEPDAASSLTKSRVVLEKLVVQVYTFEMKQAPRKTLLGELLADNQFTRKIERRILSRMNAIRDMGNLGPHGEAVQPKDAARVLDDLCEVLEWYLQRYGTGAAARGESDTDAPAAQAVRGTGHRAWRRSGRVRWIAAALALAAIIALGFYFFHTGPAGPNPDLTPTFGSVTLSTGFLPDPYTKSVQAGGPQRTDKGSVNAWVARPPSFQLTYQAGKLPLTIFALSNANTTLLIRLPDGAWIANDDGPGLGLNPRVHFERPQSGRYDIWVGLESAAAESAPATLYISEPTGDTPTFGSVDLKVGFVPDPHVQALVAGGPSLTTKEGVSAWFASRPDFQLNYTAGKLALTIYVESKADTVLLIKGPDGALRFTGQDQRAQPMIRFAPPQSGRYDIWVGTRQKAEAPAQLLISEVSELK